MTEAPKRALITGITGQDGSYLAELLLEKGYEVHGLIHRSSSFNTGRIDHLYRDPHETQTRLFFQYADLTDSSSLIGHLHRIKPDQVYNLGAQSHVKVSFEMPEFTAETAGMGTLRMLEAVRTADWPIRFYQAGSSEMYGKALETPRRGGTFVTRKVTRGVGAILKGEREHLKWESSIPLAVGMRTMYDWIESISFVPRAVCSDDRLGGRGFAKLLLDRGYVVDGLIRRSRSFNLPRSTISTPDRMRRFRRFLW